MQPLVGSGDFGRGDVDRDALNVSDERRAHRLVLQRPYVADDPKGLILLQPRGDHRGAGDAVSHGLVDRPVAVAVAKLRGHEVRATPAVSVNPMTDRATLTKELLADAEVVCRDVGIHKSPTQTPTLGDSPQVVLTSWAGHANHLAPGETVEPARELRLDQRRPPAQGRNGLDRGDEPGNRQQQGARDRHAADPEPPPQKGNGTHGPGRPRVGRHIRVV